MPQQDELLRRLAVEAYPAIYERVITEWQQTGPDAFWLLYSANYLFRVGKVRWAIDPMTLINRLSGTLPRHPEEDFSCLDFLILTHQHSDHLNWNFLKSLASLPVLWIIPEFLVEECKKQTGVTQDRIIPAIIERWIEIRGIRI